MNSRRVILSLYCLLFLGLGALWSTTPLRLWPMVMAFGVTALWEWHVGWWTSPRETT